MKLESVQLEAELSVVCFDHRERNHSEFFCSTADLELAGEVSSLLGGKSGGWIFLEPPSVWLPSLGCRRINTGAQRRIAASSSTSACRGWDWDCTGAVCS